MTTVTENDLTQLNQKIDRLVNSFNQVLINQEKIEQKLTDVEKHQIKLETELKGLSNQFSDDKEQVNQRFDETSKRFDDVINRVNDTNNRLNTMTIGFFGIVGVLVTGLLGIIGKVVFFPNI